MVWSNESWMEREKKRELAMNNYIDLICHLNINEGEEDGKSSQFHTILSLTLT